jgi:hypothetical protein
MISYHALQPVQKIDHLPLDDPQRDIERQKARANVIERLRRSGWGIREACHIAHNVLLVHSILTEYFDALYTVEEIE